MRKIFKIVLPLILPTLLSGALMVFMRTFADYGTPMLIGENYNTLPVVVYKEFLSEIGSSDGMAAAISIIAIVITTAVFLLQKYIANRKVFSMSALHPVEAKKLHGVKNVLAHAYCYILVGLAIMPQCYVIYSSFRNTSGKLYTDGFGFGSYKEAFSTVGSSIVHTYALAFAAIFVIVLVSLFVSYVVVRRRNVFNAAIDVVSMFPETVMGSILGIALLTTFNKKPLLLTGGAFIMILSYTIRRMPYTIRSSSAILRNISPSIEEASINLGASDFKTFFKVTVPMMMSGVISGAILSWIMIITELSTSIILYTSKTKTMTLEIYSQIIRGNDGVASAISAILTFSTIIALAVFFLNARHMAYGLSLLGDYARAGRHKFMMMFELSDEAYALLSAHGAPKGMDVAEYNFRVQLLCQASWIFGSVLGGALGMVLPINTKGLDFSLTALFITILVDQLRSKENRLPALIGAGCALIMRFVMPDNMMLGGMVLLLVILMLSRCGVEAHTGGKCV